MLGEPVPSAPLLVWLVLTAVPHTNRCQSALQVKPNQQAEGGLSWEVDKTKDVNCNVKVEKLCPTRIHNGLWVPSTRSQNMRK